MSGRSGAGTSQAADMDEAEKVRLSTRFPLLQLQICKVCKYKNSAMNFLCEQCNTELESSDDNQGRTDHQYWTCKTCDFINTHLTTVCEVCEETVPAEEGRKYPCIRTSGDSQIHSRKQNEMAIKAVIKKINEDCERTGTKFVDADFPPNHSSIAKEPSSLIDPGDNWRRPEDIVVDEGDQPYEWTVYRDPKTKDFNQGELGDCWLIAAVSILASKPEMLDRILVTKSYSKYGVYGLQLCLDGEWVGVIVDDFFPCDSEGTLKFAASKRKQLFVELIEKAAAKLYGSYSALKSGRVANAMQLLTGFPVKLLYMVGNDEFKTPLGKSGIYMSMEDAHQKGFLMGVGTSKTEVSSDAYNLVGLLQYHGYTVEDVQTVVLSDLILLRNVWGGFGWRGPWCELSSDWNQVIAELRPASGIGKATEGMFWISLDNFIQFFDHVSICKVRLEWLEIRLKSCLPKKSDREYKRIRLEVTENTGIQIYLQQQHGNVMIDTDGTLLTIHDEDGNYIDSPDFMRCSLLSWSCDSFSAGVYYIYLFSHTAWEKDEITKVNLTCQSEKEVILNEESYRPSLIADVLSRLAIAHGVVKMSTKGECLTIYTLTSPQWYGFIFLAVNDNKDYSFSFKTWSVEGGNIICSRKGTLVDVVQPGKRQILQIATRTRFDGSSDEFYYPKLSDKLPKDTAGHSPAITTEQEVFHKQMPNF